MLYTVYYQMPGTTATYSEPETANGSRAISSMCGHASAGRHTCVRTSDRQVIWPADL